VRVRVKRTDVEELGHEPVEDDLCHVSFGLFGVRAAEQLAHVRAFQPLERQQPRRAVVPVDLGHQQPLVVSERRPELVRVGRLGEQVLLAADPLAKLIHQHGQAQGLELLPPVGMFRQEFHDRQVVLHYALYGGTADLDDHAGAILEPRRVDLGDGAACERFVAELLEYLLRRTAQLLFYRPARHLPGKRRHVVADPLELLDVFLGQQVGAGGKHLAELHEHRPECLEHPGEPRGQVGGLLPLGGSARHARQGGQEPLNPDPADQVTQPVGNARLRDMRDAARAPGHFENRGNPHLSRPGVTLGNRGNCLRGAYHRGVRQASQGSGPLPRVGPGNRR